MGCRGTAWHWLPMALWHQTTADRGLPALSCVPTAQRPGPQWLSSIPAHSPTPGIWEGEEHPARASPVSEWLVLCCRWDTEVLKREVTCPGSASFSFAKTAPRSSPGLELCPRLSPMSGRGDNASRRVLWWSALRHPQQVAGGGPPQPPNRTLVSLPFRVRPTLVYWSVLTFVVQHCPCLW